MTIINPGTFPIQSRPYNMIQPFTYGTGLSHAEVLESFREYVVKTLIPHVNTEIGGLSETWIENTANVLASLTATLADVDAKNAAHNVTVQQAVQDILAATPNMNITDAAVQAVLDAVGSATNAILNARYAAKSELAPINTTLTDHTTTLAGLKPVASSGAYTDLSGRPNLASVATSGAYDDLTGKPAAPTIPTLNNIPAPNGPVSLASQRITDLTNPIGANDAAPRGWVEGLVLASNELAYAERTSTFTVTGVASGFVDVDVPGLAISFVMPSRPVMLELFATILATSTTAQHPYLSIKENGVDVAQAHFGRSSHTEDFQLATFRKRITGSPGTTRTFTVTSRQRTESFDIRGNALYPAYVAAISC